MCADVFANGMAVSCKAGSGNVIAGFPDVCLSPPPPPAGPVPIPYPLFSQSSDTADGSKNVKVDGKEAMLKDKSHFKSCKGDEAATQSFGKGVVTHTLGGKVYFIAWSMDVEFEGENVVRHLDMMTSNHSSPPADEAAPMVQTEAGAAGSGPSEAECKKVLQKYPVESYDEQKNKTPKGSQSHHVVQNAHFQYPRGTTIKAICPGYSEGEAPCIVLRGGTSTRTPHGKVSKLQKADAKRYRDRLKKDKKNPTYKEAREDAKKQLQEKKPGPAMTEEEAECIMREVDKRMKKMCKNDKMEDAELRAPGQRGKGYTKRNTGKTFGEE